MDAWAGQPTSDDAKDLWRQEVIQVAKEQGINRTDLGREILLSVASEIGYWKIICICLLFLLSAVGGTIFGAVKLLRRKG